MRKSVKRRLSVLPSQGVPHRQRCVRPKLALLLGFVTVFNSVPAVPLYGAQDNQIWLIGETEELPEDILFQLVPYGTKREDLDLPRTLKVFITAGDESTEHTVAGEESDSDITVPADQQRMIQGAAIESYGHESRIAPATPGEAESSGSSGQDDEEADGRWEKIRIRWVLNDVLGEREEYDGNIAGAYVFEAVPANSAYVSGTSVLPQIIVEVMPEPGQRVITEWEWDEAPAGLMDGVLTLPAGSEGSMITADMIEPLLPGRIAARVRNTEEQTGTASDAEISKDMHSETAEEEIAIDDWYCNDFPETGVYTGEYTFRFPLPEGYVMGADAARPEIMVKLGSANSLIHAADTITVMNLSLNPANQYARIDNGTVVYGDETDYNMYWNPSAGRLQLKDLDLDLSSTGDLLSEAVIFADRNELLVVLDGENRIRVNHNRDASLSVIKNSGGRISFIPGEQVPYSLELTLELTENLIYSQKVGAIDCAGGFDNDGKIGIGITGVSGRDISGYLFGIRCGTPAELTGDAVKNSGDIHISINNDSLGATSSADAYGIAIYGPALENDGGIHAAVETTNGNAYGIMGNLGAGEWLNGKDATITVSAIAHGGNVMGMKDVHKDSNFSAGLAVLTDHDIHMINSGDMELKTVNNGKSAPYESAVGLYLMGSSAVLENEGGIIASALEGNSVGINLETTRGDTILVNSGSINATATTDGLDIGRYGNREAAGIQLGLYNSAGTQLPVTLNLLAGSSLVTQAFASDELSEEQQREVNEKYCQALLLQKEYGSDPGYTEVLQEIILEEGLVIHRGGTAFAMLDEEDPAGGKWVYVNTIGDSVSKVPARDIEIGPAIVLDMDWPAAALGYGQSLVEATLAGGVARTPNGEEVDGVFSFADESLRPSVRESNETYYKMVFTPAPKYGGRYQNVTADRKVTVNPGKLSLTMKELPDEAQAGHDITLQADIGQLINHEVPAGSVKFSVDGRVLAQAPVDAATLTASVIWQRPAAGTYLLTAEYLPVEHDNYTGDKIAVIDHYIVKGIINESDSSNSDDNDGNSAVAGGRWIKDEVGWRYMYANRMWARGRLVTGTAGEQTEYYQWEQINGAWYAFDADGYAAEGVIFDPAYNGYFYIDINTGMKVGWHLIDGEWYYFNPVSDGRKGIMYSDTWIDGRYLGHDGVWREGTGS